MALAACLDRVGFAGEARPDLAILRGRTLRRLLAAATTGRLIGSADAFVAAPDDVFGLDLPEAADLWPIICARHEALFSPT